MDHTCSYNRKNFSLENRKSGLAKKGQISLWAKAEDWERKNTRVCMYIGVGITCVYVDSYLCMCMYL